jgi:hypothetical protein
MLDGMALSRRQLLQRLGFSAGTLGLGCLPKLSSAQDPKLGYTDTPIIPGTKWRVHDGMRPQPKIVTPGPVAAWAPPSDAIVLFDGKNLDAWTHNGATAKWKVENGAFVVTPGTGQMATREKFGDCQLHLEFMCPNPPKGNGQGRSNSGVFFNGLYELQVLDSYQNPTYPDGMVGSLYSQYPPLVNSIRPPGQWNIYDIVFMYPLWEGEKLIRPAIFTVFLNGVLLHNGQALMGTTWHRSLGTYKKHDPMGQISLQDHGDPVRFRNIWLRKVAGYDAV